MTPEQRLCAPFLPLSASNTRSVDPEPTDDLRGPQNGTWRVSTPGAPEEYYPDETTAKARETALRAERATALAVAWFCVDEGMSA